MRLTGDRAPGDLETFGLVAESTERPLQMSFAGPPFLSISYGAQRI